MEEVGVEEVGVEEVGVEEVGVEEVGVEEVGVEEVGVEEVGAGHPTGDSEGLLAFVEVGTVASIWFGQVKRSLSHGWEQKVQGIPGGVRWTFYTSGRRI